MSKLRALLSVSLKRHFWNLKYGFLGYPQFVAPEDVLEYLSARLGETSSILDLGCGRGALLPALRQRGFKGSYCGVEISVNALKQATKCMDQRSAWVASDIENFSSSLHWDVITLIESVYYIDVRQLSTTLPRLIGFLKTDGFALLRWHDTDKHRDYIEAIRELYPSMEKVGPNLFSISAPQRRTTSRSG